MALVLTFEHHQRMIDRFPQVAIAPAVEIAL